MLSKFAVLIFLNVINTFTKVLGEPTLLIAKQIDDTEIPVPEQSIIVIPSGTNLTLTCNTIDLESQVYLNNEVVWIKQTSDLLKFQGSDDLKQQIDEEPFESSTAASEPSKLSFTPVALHHQGTYVCKNVQHNVFKNLSLVVRGRRWKNVSRRKRAQLGSNYQQGTFSRRPQTDMPPINPPNPVKDFLNHRKTNKFSSVNDDIIVGNGDYYNQWRKYGISNYESGNSHWPYDSNSYSPYAKNWPAQDSFEYPSYVSNNVEFKDPKITYVKTKNISKPTSKNQYGFLYFLAAMIGLTLVGQLIYFANRDKRPQSSRQPPIALTTLARERETAPSALLVPLNCNSEIPISVAHSNNDDDRGDSVLTSLITPSGAVQNDNTLDAPPSYANSARNSVYNSEETSSNPKVIGGCDLPPPSYDEALANIIPSPSIDAAPSYTLNVARVTSPDIERGAPVISHNDL